MTEHLKRAILLVSCGLCFVSCNSRSEKTPQKELTKRPVSVPAQFKLSFDDPGAAALEMEDVIAKPVERVLLQEKSIELVETRIRKGHCEVTVTLRAGSDVASAKRAVMASIGKLQGLPDKLETRLPPMGLPVLWVVWSSDEKQIDTATLANALRARMVMIPHVDDVEIVGATRTVIEVVVDPDTLVKHGVTPRGIQRAIRQHRANEVDGKGLPSLADLEELTIKTGADGTPTRLKQLAKVGMSTRTESFAYWNGEPTVAFGIVSAKTNTDKVIQAVEKQLDQWKDKLKIRGDLRVAFRLTQSPRRGATFLVESKLPSGAPEEDLHQMGNYVYERITRAIGECNRLELQFPDDIGDSTKLFVGDFKEPVTEEMSENSIRKLLQQAREWPGVMASVKQ